MTGEAAKDRTEQQPTEDEIDDRERTEQTSEDPSSPAGAEGTDEVPPKQIHRWKDDGGAVIFD